MENGQVFVPELRVDNEITSRRTAGYEEGDNEYIGVTVRWSGRVRTT